jgi:hypothetical protein
MVQLRIPEIRVGRAITSQGIVMYPLRLAQRLLIPDEHRGLDCLLGSNAKRKGWVKITPVREVGGFTETIVNQSDGAVLFLPGDRLATGRSLNAPVLVDAHAEVRVLSNCCVYALGQPVPLGRPVRNSIGAVLVTGGYCYLHLFGDPNVCAKAWGRLLPAPGTKEFEGFAKMGPICRSEKELAAREAKRAKATVVDVPFLRLGRTEIADLIRTVNRLSWQRVRAVGGGDEFAASEAKIRGTTLYVGRQLVYLRVLYSELLP